MEDTAEKLPLIPVIPEKKISRREFFHRVGLFVTGAITTSVLPDANGNTFAGELGTRLIANLFAQKDNKGADDTSKLISREAAEDRNQNYRPYLAILREGVEEFQHENPTFSVVWNKSPFYLDDYETAVLLSKPIEEDEVSTYSEGEKYKGRTVLECLGNVVKGESPWVAYMVFYNRLPEEIKNVINTVNTNMVALPGTELYENFQPKVGNVFSHEDVTKYYEQIKKDLENLFAQQEKQKPLPLTKLIFYFLEKNKGELSPALGDMAGFLKYLIRGDDTDQGEIQIEWYRTHIQDQINKNFSLNNISLDNLSNEDLENSVKSIWGLLYHVPSLVYLLSYLSPNLIRLAVVYEYVSHGHEAEGYKLKVDTEFMKDLKNINAYLQSFSIN